MCSDKQTEIFWETQKEIKDEKDNEDEVYQQMMEFKLLYPNYPWF